MSDKIQEKVAYLRGLMDGLKVDPATDEGKLFAAIAETLSAVASEVAGVREDVDSLTDFVDEVSDDLSALEEAVDELYEDYDEEEDDSCDCDDCDDCEQDDAGDDLIELECPKCGYRIYYDVESFNIADEHICPKCRSALFEADEQPDDE